MFTHIGRRLALLNAVVVIAIIALVGGTMYVALRASLDAEIDSALRDRVTAIRPAVQELLAGNAATVDALRREAEEGEEGEPWHDEGGEAILRMGDTILLVVDRSGRLVYDPRGVGTTNVPIMDGINAALAGREDTRSVTLSDTGPMRVLTVPVVTEEGVVGAVQALRSLREHDRELEIVRAITLLGTALGAVIAVPAGLYLARRAMEPINVAFERQRTFVSDASHELRTPLTLIRASTEYALQDPSAPVAEIAPDLHNILEEVDRTDRLVDDLLTLARIDAGQLELRREPRDLGTLLRAAAERMQPLAAAGDLTLITEPPATSCQALVDSDRVIQAIRILIDNAIKYTPPGGEIRVSASCSDRLATITVRDTGVGIPAEDIPHIFDRFYRVDRARTRATGGTGLGLPIAKAIVEAHGGRISLASQVGVGTLVTIVLPRDAAPATSPATSVV